MKSVASRFFTIVLKLSAALAACIGCSDPGQPPPGQIRWRGPETGFKSNTAIEPNDAGKTKEAP